MIYQDQDQELGLHKLHEMLHTKSNGVPCSKVLIFVESFQVIHDVRMQPLMSNRAPSSTKNNCIILHLSFLKTERHIDMGVKNFGRQYGVSGRHLRTYVRFWEH